MNIFAIHHNNKLQQSNGDIKLPKIDPINAKGMKLQLKSTTKLPNLKSDQKNQGQVRQKIKQIIREPETELLINQTKVRQRQKSEGDDFVTEVQKKLKIVLEEQNIVNIAESDESDDDFQQKINKNREILKMRKIKRENQEEQTVAQAQIQKELMESKKKKQVMVQNKKSVGLEKQRSKNQSLYEKRIKDYKEFSLENKFLMKKKENMQKQTLFSSKKQQLTNDQSAINMANFKSNKNQQKKKTENQRASNKLVSSANASVLKDEELFDNIHNILLNPNQQRRESFEKVKEAKQKKQQLEEKIKQLQLKIASQKKEDVDLIEKIRSQSNSETLKGEFAVQNEQSEMGKDDITIWRKIQVNNLNLKEEKSNFDHQIERVNRYFERNEKSIETYVQNQKLLVDIHSLKKVQPSN